MEWNKNTYTEKEILDMKQEAEKKVLEMQDKAKTNVKTTRNRNGKGTKTVNSNNGSRTKKVQSIQSDKGKSQCLNTVDTNNNGRSKENKGHQKDNDNGDLKDGQKHNRTRIAISDPSSIDSPEIIIKEKSTIKIPIINKEISKDTLIVLALVISLINGECDDQFIIFALLYILFF